ncbi:MAG TPA: hypothetical protein VME43_03890 [Bryobacteraceae bacterium]|nr:hypothetical protein [Bryobacteraceae bacterium]
MNKQCFLAGILAAAMGLGLPLMAASIPDTPEVPAQMVITLRPGQGGSLPARLEAGDLTVAVDRNPAHVVRLQRLAGDLANMQLFVLLDDSSRSSSLGVHLGELKAFIRSLPPTTQVAVGYMRNGSFALAQGFTADHQKATDSLRLPEALPGGNGSPYFALSDLVKHWPSQQATNRRTVLMLTDGVDRYWGTSEIDDPYLDQAVHSALKDGVMVYSIYLRGAGLYGRGGWVKDFAQSRLMQVSQETGGNAYFETFSDPVEIAPFLSDLQGRLANQYQVSVQTSSRKGVQPVKVRTESPGMKIDSPTRIWVP